MCGIAGCVNQQEAGKFLRSALCNMEYRGYDSWGIGIKVEGKFAIQKKVGSISDVDPEVFEVYESTCGIGHTRWATHGPNIKANAHPIIGGKGKGYWQEQSVLLVHNGTVDNYAFYRDQLEKEGFEFQTDTDTEIIAHSIAHAVSVLDLKYCEVESLMVAIRNSLPAGQYAVVFMLKGLDCIFAISKGSPLWISNKGHVASDIRSFSGYAEKAVIMQPNSMVVLNSLYNMHWCPITEPLREINLQSEYVLVPTSLDVDMNGHDTYMEKEIHEQPEVVRDILSCCVATGRKPERIVLLGCGTSYHAARIAKTFFEDIADIPTEAEHASELRYSKALQPTGTLHIVVSQSGETKDVITAMESIEKFKYPIWALTNNSKSTIAQKAEAHFDLFAGQEIGVASTKCFTAELLMLYRMANEMAGIDRRKEEETLATQIESILSINDTIEMIARQYKDANNFLFLGSGLDYPVAREGALKLKELSYIHAEGMPASEMKHGPIALIDKDMPTLVLISDDADRQRVLHNMQEIKARGGKIIAVGSGEAIVHAAVLAENFISVPKTYKYLQPILHSIPLQMFAYHIAKQKGLNVDKPRNLAKSVTV